MGDMICPFKELNDRVSEAATEIIDAMANATERYIFGNVLPADKSADRRHLYGTAHLIMERHLRPLIDGLVQQQALVMAKYLDETLTLRAKLTTAEDRLEIMRQQYDALREDLEYLQDTGQR